MKKMKREHITAIVLAGGQGKRMGNDIPKQYLSLDKRPILYYSLKELQQSKVDSIVLVTGKGEASYCCNSEIIQKYGFEKVTKIVEGGKERYHSVYAGLCAAGACDYVMIHDGARPFMDAAMIQVSIDSVKQYDACAVGVPVKDTIKIVNEEGFATQTPDRSKMWMIQTPQTFSYSLIKQAYDWLMTKEGIHVTDDAMVVEIAIGRQTKLIEGSYRNIKITTPSDLTVAEEFIKENKMYT